MPSLGKFVQSKDGTRIWTHAAGNPAKPAVVFIPGFSLLVPAIPSSDFSVSMHHFHQVRYDPRGQGQSGQPLKAEDYHTERYADDFKAVLDEYKLRKPFVCGWSIGAIIPADILSYHGPDAISGVIIAGGFPWRSMHGEVANPWIVEFIPRLLANDLEQWGETAKAFVESCVAYPDDMPQLTKYAWMGGVSGQHPQVRLLALPRGQDENGLLSVKDTLPFLVLHGTMDKHVLGDKLEKFMHDHFKNVEFHMWDHCGHAPFFDRPEEFNKTTLEWVNKITKA